LWWPPAVVLIVAGTNDYNAASAQVTINVMPASLTITAKNQSRAYGAANRPLTCTLVGFVNGDTSASLTTLPLVSTATVHRPP
jgi:hypothetical protein